MFLDSLKDLLQEGLLVVQLEDGDPVDYSRVWAANPLSEVQVVLSAPLIRACLLRHLSMQTMHVDPLPAIEVLNNHRALMRWLLRQVCTSQQLAYFASHLLHISLHLLFIGQPALT